MQVKCREQSAHFKPFPTESREVDCYRGITVMTRIHEKLYPTPVSEAKKMITIKERDG